MEMVRKQIEQIQLIKYILNDELNQLYKSVWQEMVNEQLDNVLKQNRETES